MTTSVTYSGNGTQKNYAFPFPYLDKLHVGVYVNGTKLFYQADYQINGSTVEFAIAPGFDAGIELKRETTGDVIVDFVDGSTLRESDLDTAYLQNLYRSEEFSESFNKLINDAILEIANGAGIVTTTPGDVIHQVVFDILNSQVAADIQQRIQDIDDNAEAIIQLGEALQVQIDTLAQGVAASVFIQDDEPVAGVGNIPDPIPEGARWYDSNDNNKAYLYVNGVWVAIEDPRLGQVIADVSVLQTSVGDNTAAILNEAFLRSTADTAIASELSLLGVQNGAQDAFILDSNTVKLDTDTGDTLANRFSQITADTGGLQAQITAEQIARSDGDSALAADISLLGVKNGTNSAFILDTSTVKIDSDSGDTFAQRLSSLSATDANNTAAINTVQTVTIPGLESDVAAVEAKYGVQLNVNGYVTGFEQNNNGLTGTFKILADRFAVVEPTAGPGDPGLVPFEINGSKIDLRGDVNVNGSLLVNGSVVGDAIASGAITPDKITVNDLSAITADLGTITAGSISMDTAGFIQGGATAYDVGTGYWMGYNNGKYKFRIGSVDSYLLWDGDNLSIKGDLLVGAYVANPDRVVLSADTERGNFFNTFVKLKEFIIDKGGQVNLDFTTRLEVTNQILAPGTYSVRINGNQVLSGTTTSGPGELVRNTLTINEGDVISIWARGGEWGTTGDPRENRIYIKDARIGGEIVFQSLGSVTLD